MNRLRMGNLGARKGSQVAFPVVFLGVLLVVSLEASPAVALEVSPAAPVALVAPAARVALVARGEAVDRVVPPFITTESGTSPLGREVLVLQGGGVLQTLQGTTLMVSPRSQPSRSHPMRTGRKQRG